MATKHDDKHDKPARAEAEADQAPVTQGPKDVPPLEQRPPNWPYAPATTVADEQRARSEDIQKTGVEQWKAQRDERGPEDKPKQVPGVGPTEISDTAGPKPGSWEGSTRSTPEARAAQHRSAP